MKGLLLALALSGCATLSHEECHDMCRPRPVAVYAVSMGKVVCECLDQPELEFPPNRGIALTKLAEPRAKPTYLDFSQPAAAPKTYRDESTAEQWAWVATMLPLEIVAHELTHFAAAKAFGMHNYKVKVFPYWYRPIGESFDGEPTRAQLAVIYLSPKLLWVPAMVFGEKHSAIRGFAIAGLLDALLSLEDWRAGIQGG